MSEYHKTKLAAEQAAGRRAIELAVHQELLEKGYKELQRRFPAATLGVHLRKDGEEWLALVSAETATGTVMSFKSPFLGFPSDLLITEIALVV